MAKSARQYLYLSPFSPPYLWKPIAAKLWEGRLRAKDNHSHLDRSQASFLPPRLSFCGLRLRPPLVITVRPSRHHPFQLEGHKLGRDF